jgi:uncharacterized membrane protein
MCLHLILAVVARYRKNQDPGHDNNARWMCDNYWASVWTLLGALGFLILVGAVLEWFREHYFFDGHVTRQETAVPILVFGLLVLITLLELICLYRDIRLAYEATQNRGPIGPAGTNGMESDDEGEDDSNNNIVEVPVYPDKDDD